MAYISQNYMQSKFYVQILSNFTVWSFEAKYYIYATDPSPFENIERKNIVCTKTPFENIEIKTIVCTKTSR